MYSDKKTGKTTSIHRTSKNVEPSKLLERERLYEWCVLMFHIEITNRDCLVVDGYNAIKLLKYKLKISIKEKQFDELEECITNIFGTIDENDTIEDGNDAETVEVINDDYGYSLPQTDYVEDTPISSEIRGGSVNKLGLSNIFNLGHEKLVEMKIPAVRERKQNRMLRSQAFFLKVNEIVTHAEDTANTELTVIENIMTPKPWFRQIYRQIIDK